MDNGKYDIVADTSRMISNIDKKELDSLVALITLDDSKSIVGFGADAASNISKSSDAVLNSMNMYQLNDSGKILSSLSRIMNSFDIKEIKEDKPKGIKRFFYNTKKHIDAMISKYSSMGDEIDKMYVQLKEYEKEINESNTKLNDLFESNLGYYHDLVKYIAAGEQACDTINNHIKEMQVQYTETNDSEIQFEIQNYQQGLDALKARVNDLRMAQNVAMQSIPMIKNIEYSNLHLVRKINSAFIVTLPVFKQSLAQAMMLKRQKIQAKSLEELDKRTNEMLLKNAENTVIQSKLIEQLATSSSVSIDTLEKTWSTISKGIEDTNKIREESYAKYQKDKERLNVIKKEFDEKYVAVS